MQTVSEIMDRLGGIAKVSKETGFPFTTVHSWKRAEHVPEWRRPALLKLAERLGVPLADEDFPPRPDTNQPVAA